MSADRDDLADAARELVRTGRALTTRADAVLDADAKRDADIAAIRARLDLLERPRPAPSLSHASPVLQAAVGLALVIAVLAGAVYAVPGVVAALPLLPGAAHAP